MRVLFISAIFCSSSHFSEQRSSWQRWVVRSNEVAGIENQIWREYSCNPLINWKFPKLARIKTSCISQGRRGVGEGSGSQVATRDDAWYTRVWVVWEGGGEEARVTCHLMIIHYPQGSEVTSGERRGGEGLTTEGQMWHRFPVKMSQGLITTALLFVKSIHRMFMFSTVVFK